MVGNCPWLCGSCPGPSYFALDPPRLLPSLLLWLSGSLLSCFPSARGHAGCFQAHLSGFVSFSVLLSLAHCCFSLCLKVWPQGRTYLFPILQNKMSVFCSDHVAVVLGTPPTVSLGSLRVGTVLCHTVGSDAGATQLATSYPLASHFDLFPYFEKWTLDIPYVLWRLKRLILGTCLEKCLVQTIWSVYVY